VSYCRSCRLKYLAALYLLCLSILGIGLRFVKNRTMRFVFLLLLCLTLFAGCHSVKHRGNPTDPERAESVDAMRAAEAEAKRQADNW
jgi:hypothetical protein